MVVVDVLHVKYHVPQRDAIPNLVKIGRGGKLKLRECYNVPQTESSRLGFLIFVFQSCVTLGVVDSMISSHIEFLYYHIPNSSDGISSSNVLSTLYSAKH